MVCGSNVAVGEHLPGKQISRADFARISAAVLGATAKAGQSSRTENSFRRTQYHTTLTPLMILHPAPSCAVSPDSLTVTTATQNREINCTAIISGSSSQPNAIDDSPVQSLELQMANVEIMEISMTR